MIIEVSAPTMISEGTRVQGSLSFHSRVQVFGVVEGELTQQSLEVLQVGRSGWVHGTIDARGPVLVEGRVEGNIISSTEIRLLPTAIVRGNLKAPKIEIRAGAVFEGATETPREGKVIPLKPAA